MHSLPSNCVAWLAAWKYWADKNVLFDRALYPFALQLHITISPDKVKLNVDCQEVAEKPIKEANNITLDGYEVLGKMVRSGGGRRQSATVSEKESLCIQTPNAKKHTYLEEQLKTFQRRPDPNPPLVRCTMEFNCAWWVLEEWKPVSQYFSEGLIVVCFQQWTFS